MPAQRILILDDEPNIGSSLRMILEREGYAVNFCRSVAELFGGKWGTDYRQSCAP